MTFATNASALMQEHFTIVEIDLPAFGSGQTCNFLGGTGYYTPLTCDETWDGTTEQTYYFSTPNKPLTYGRPPSSSGMPGDVVEVSDPIHPIIKGINETATELRPGQGLALLGEVRITLVDKTGDPGPVTTTTAGTFIGKLAARNILNGKDLRIKDYHINSDGIYADDDARVRYYVIESLKNNGNGTWTLYAKDELTRLEDDKTQFPAPTGGTIRTSVNNSTTTIPVDATTDWSVTTPYVIRVGDELMKVTAVANNQTASAELTVATRGADIAFTNTLSTATADSHDAGDDIQICYTSDNQDIDDFLYDVITLAGVPAARIPTADWASEIAEWHASDKINMIWHEPESSREVVRDVCNDFLLDIWFDPEDREINLSAISVWKVTGPTLTEGKQINFESFKIAQKEDMRFSRAFVYHNKPDKVADDGIENFREMTVNINSVPEAAGLYSEPKTKKFPPSPILSANAAALLTQRYAARFGFTPEEYTWTTEEKFLNFATGDVVTLSSPEKQDYAGASKELRAQVTSVQPIYDTAGARTYTATALTFEAAFADDSEFTISSSSQEVNIHTFVGAPSQAVDVTLIIDGCTVGSSSSSNTALFAGSFASGSTITIILKNSAEIQGAGGAGGSGGASIDSGTVANFSGLAGFAGGTAYDAQGIDTDVYLGGTVGSHTALGLLKAPGGGGGGEDGQGVSSAIGGDAGGGGAGSDPGVGGAGGAATGGGSPVNGTAGSSGSTAGTGGAAGGAGAGAGGAWGAAGSAGDQAGGAAGKGILKGGGVVNIYTAGNSSRFVNGGGDTPDATT